MQTPPYLKTGDTVAIIATARKITPEEVKPAIDIFNKWGLNVITGENLFNEKNQFAGGDELRLVDFQNALDNPEVKAIICARGGYGTIRIIDKIDFSTFIKSPKWIIGYSDITVLHSHIHKISGIETLHATMPINFPKDNTQDAAVESLSKALFGKQLQHILENNLSGLNRTGEAESIVVGGNLSILYSLSGTKSQIDTKGKILFIEDLDEYLYHVDRMMMNMKRSGMLENISGLIVGGMSDMRDNLVPFGKTAEEIIKEAVAEYKFPVCFNFPAGHIKNNLAFFLGRKARLSVKETSVSLSY